tara:strand:+ start:59 stop:463 length:405 start_codon:yes stop_codon:yes gene_type:complete
MQKLENLAEQTIFFFILRLLRTDPLKVLNRDEIEIISHNVQKVCGITNPKSFDLVEISINCLIRPEKYDEDFDKAESYIKNLFSDESEVEIISKIINWAEEVADVWKDYNLYPPEYPGQQDWDMLPSPHKIKWK